jgi:hypothetical protein
MPATLACPSFDKGCEKYNSHNNFISFVNFTIEIFQNLPLIFQIPKDTFNEHTTTIH